MHCGARRTTLLSGFVVFFLFRSAFVFAAAPTTKVTSAQTASPSSASPAASAEPLSARDRLVFAHTLFLEQPTNDRYFVFSDTETYNAVLDALNHWGRYRIVSQADQADLVLQLHGVTIASSTVSPDPTTTPDTTTYAFQLKATLADPHTLSPVWEAKTPVYGAFRHRHHATNAAAAGENITSQLKLLAEVPLTAQERKSLRDANSLHLARNLLFIGAGAGLSAGIFFVARHHAQSNQAAFCQQNHISPCPGA